jgi:CRISPR/Cas system-associated exonuclease Cas4 (RecB family)
MSEYYKPDRGPRWNYGGDSWKLSRSKISLFQECPQCFYIDNKLGTKRPPGFPFNLNSAVDALLKKEFDTHRANGSTHPLMEKYGLDAVPFDHEQMDAWRDALKRGVEFFHEKTGFRLSGAVDDIWQKPNGELIVVDYKATSKDGRIESLDEAWHDGYKRQIEIYQWLLRQNGFKVSNTAYWVYANASKDKEAFDGQLEFEITLVPYEGDDSWVEGILEEIKDCLESDELPDAAGDCDYCRYRNTVGKKLFVFAKKLSPKKSPLSDTMTVSDSLGI